MSLTVRRVVKRCADNEEVAQQLILAGRFSAWAYCFRPGDRPKRISWGRIGTAG
jgi:hypothetical protein